MLPNRAAMARRPSLLLLTRYASTSDAKLIKPNPSKITSDMVGPPDPVSNLRRIIFRKPANETSLERKYRKLRTEVQEWNQKILWHSSKLLNNVWRKKCRCIYLCIDKEREEYLKSNLPEGKTNLTADEMSVFYKAFLDKNWRAHLDYNREWYKKNVTLLILALKVKFRKLLRIKE